MTMQRIQHIELGSAQASIDFTSIPQDGTDLLLVLSTRSARVSQATDDLFVSFNGVTSSFSNRTLRGIDNAVSSFAYGGGRFIGLTTASSATSSTFGSISLYIPNYASSANKSFSADAVTENNSATSAQEIIAGLWSNTAAITSIAITSATSNNFVAGSSATLYKITKGSDGTTTVS